jgi:NDP-sugar pyrophosphorylase family protein
MLLTAGLGERMKPLSSILPKPALPILGRPMAVQILEQLGRQGIERAVLNLHHLPEEMRRTIADADASRLPRIDFTEEPEILGTAGGIGNAASLLRGDGPILVRNSDFLADIDISRLLEAHRGSGMLATLVLAPLRAGYSAVDLDNEGKVISIAGMPEVDRTRVAASHLFTGCHIIEEPLLDRIPEGRASDIVRDVYVDLIAEDKLGACIHDGFWWEFGSPELYLDGALSLIGLEDDIRERIACCDPVKRIGAADVALGHGALIHETARLHGRVAVGASAELAESVSVEDSILMPGAVAGACCSLKRTILAPGLHLPPGFNVENALVCRTGDEPLVARYGGAGGRS